MYDICIEHYSVLLWNKYIYNALWYDAAFTYYVYIYVCVLICMHTYTVKGRSNVEQSLYYDRNTYIWNVPINVVVIEKSSFYPKYPAVLCYICVWQQVTNIVLGVWLCCTAIGHC